VVKEQNCTICSSDKNKDMFLMLHYHAMHVLIHVHMHTQYTQYSMHRPTQYSSYSTVCIQQYIYTVNLSAAKAKHKFAVIVFLLSAQKEHDMG
jgi:hypothetical protein